jgi:hypothetical protein
MALQAIEQIPATQLVGVNGYPLVERGNRYGEQYFNQYSLDRLGDEGSLFRVRNATLGTGIAQTQNTTQDTAKPFLAFVVPSTAIKSFRPLRIWMRPTAVASGQTIQNIDVITDVGGTRASAGTDYNLKVTGLNASVGYNPVGRSGLNPSSILSQLYVGVPVWTPGSQQQLQARFQPRTTTIPVVGDEYIINFGSLFAGGPVPVVTPVSTTINTYVKNEPAIVVEPGCGMIVIPWAAGIGSAMSWEFDLIWAER